MAKIFKVTVLRSDNRIIVDPTPAAVLDKLMRAFSFVAKKFLYNWREVQANGGSKLQLTNYDCYVIDHRGRFATSVGFYVRLKQLLEANGCEVGFEDLSPHSRPEVLVPAWDRLFDPLWKVELRYGQEDFLVKMATAIKDRMYGRFDCPPGFGKSKIVSLAGLLYPKARIHVVSKRVPVIRDRIYPELCRMLSDVGIVGGGRNITGRRIMCFTADSLGHSDGNCDILFGDEIHELCADAAAEKMARYSRSVNIGLSATHDMRLDNKNMRGEAMFGPIVYSMDYREAAAHGLVVPIEIVWHDVVMDSNPCDPDGTPVNRKRHGIWRNQVRNQIIAADAQSYGEEVQRLITCETIEHALHLKKILPDYALVYAENGVKNTLKQNDVQYYQRLGVWPSGHQIMNFETRKRLTDQFERGVLKKVIATTVWNVGVSFNHLAVLLRADAGASPTMDTQIPGRTSRLNAAGGKTCGRIHDYLDQFDEGFRLRALGRSRSYAAQHWKQSFPVRDP